MYVQSHLALGLIFALILLAIFPQIGLIGFLLIFSSTVLIDVDHYIYYVYKKKDWKINNAYSWFIKKTKKFHTLSRTQRNKVYGGFCFLHGTEILLVLLLFTIFSKYFLFIFIGFTFHLFLDITYSRFFMDRIDRISLVHDFFKFKKLKHL
ncbi:hypothetical protein CMI39_00925 [Candidatus Pacearchaeota archaeon]|jgi:hypothetical protein|nr:hypothetical protein [Candidatus Pacearchaeota archaeon]|tara:strand:+ start:6870 stop:7322 length:453 start_codon:yes stop_codon:yes gene_type:complete